MPKFHFDLVDARTAEDEQADAQFCHNEEQAQMLANNIAGRLAASEPVFLSGYCVLVTDANGVEIYRAALGQHRDQKVS